MSSNTLRGIGQEGEGEDEGEVTPPPTKVATSIAAASDDQAAKPTNRLMDVQELRQDARQNAQRVRPVEATGPSARSLDASVPDAQPSLDAKVPALAATLLGVAPPAIGTIGMGGRDAGTVQGRDIHLPVEAQRQAGVRAIVGAGALPGRGVGEAGAVPVAVELSEPTRADPIRTAVIAQSTTDPTQTLHPDLATHAPWYDQEPVTGDVYEDRKPNVAGRVAIGVAVAAAVSVIVFAIIRFNAQNAAIDAVETPSKPTAAYTSPSPPVPAPSVHAEPRAPSESPPPLPPPPLPTAREVPANMPAHVPSIRSARSAESADLAPSGPTGPGTSASASASVRTRPDAIGHVGPTAPPTKPPARPVSPVRVTPPGALPRATVPTLAEPAGPPALDTPAAPAQRTPSEATTTPTAPPPRPATSDKPRTKPSYDPDSTLPLNLD